MKTSYYEIHTFTEKSFCGNPAGVCLLQEWLPDDILQRIAEENRLPETAFVVPKGKKFELRWFTPKLEMDLCGHATLAAAFVLFEEQSLRGNEVVFDSKSGELHVKKSNGLIVLNFPARPGKSCSVPSELIEGLGSMPLEVKKARDFLVIYSSEDEIASLSPDLGLIKKLDALGVIVTAPSQRADFVSRFFAPGAGIDEDPVTGSAHCTLIPYWAERLKKKTLHALQISPRGGELWCEDLGDRVQIGGKAVLYLRGEIEISLPQK